MRTRLRIDQLCVDPDLVARPLDASFEDIANAQLVANLLGLGRLVAVAERGIAGNYKHVSDPRQIGRQVLGDRVGEILLVRVAVQVGERQHDDRHPRCAGTPEPAMIPSQADEQSDQNQRSQDTGDQIPMSPPRAVVSSHGNNGRGWRGIDDAIRLVYSDGWSDNVRFVLRTRDRRYKAIATSGDRLNAAPLRPPLIQDPAKRGYLDSQVAVLDHRSRPNGSDELVFRNEIPRPLDDHAEDVEGARADRDRNEITAFISPEKTAAAPIETEALE